ncbi:hypothetical protein [Aquimarina sp. RZ0]|uniref:hypothetical protein n=1 Tax=Aquimarina sp. RZ0 TaxID=2607730 RepID=UPI0011F1F4B4|nr:hypothetical protein [Aquimarina sp. RZ0]KAA1242958.1 hypothetical protein F0000_23305 [Aquimarina sp. RZ0]
MKNIISISLLLILPFISFSYKKRTYEGTPPEITVQLEAVAKELGKNQMISRKREELELLQVVLKKSEV